MKNGEVVAILEAHREGFTKIRTRDYVDSRSVYLHSAGLLESPVAKPVPKAAVAKRRA